jgi:RepB DNA-primase from phage plasmid
VTKSCKVRKNGVSPRFRKSKAAKRSFKRKPVPRKRAQLTVTNEEFVAAMHAHIPDGAAAMVCGFLGDPNAPPEFAWAALPCVPGRKLPWKIQRHYNNYATISSFQRSDDNKYRRRKAQFARLDAVMFDDLGTKIDLNRVRTEPSTRLETSPGNYQDYVFIEPSAASDDRPTCERLIDGLIKGGLTSNGIDPGMAGVTRVGRMPVGVNGKKTVVQKLGHEFAVRLVIWNPSTRYTVEALAEIYGIDLTALPEREHTAIDPEDIAHMDAGFAALIRVFRIVGRYHGKSGEWHQVTCPWIEDHTVHADTGTAIIGPSPENGFNGGFKCHHGHCRGRIIENVWDWVHGLSDKLKKQPGAAR